MRCLMPRRAAMMGHWRMQALKALTITMGVLIFLGTAVLAVVLARRMGSGSTVPPLSVLLDEPAGTRIAAIAGAGDRLAVQLQGGGPDRLVLIDPHTGAAVGRVGLAR
jgi:hypothetical protein